MRVSSLAPLDKESISLSTREKVRCAGSFPVDLVDGANCERIIYDGVCRGRGCV